MNREDIIAMAREANLEGYPEELERFAALIAAAEREACAKVCETPVDEIQITDEISDLIYADGKECAAAIRTRGQA